MLNDTFRILSLNEARPAPAPFLLDGVEEAEKAPEMAEEEGWVVAESPPSRGLLLEEDEGMMDAMVCPRRLILELLWLLLLLPVSPPPSLVV